ncbi:MAG TPA: proton-conducting transporter membrane subunit, partial [Chroococcales cyanobacterium]
VSALLSGALLNCTFLGILRVYQVCLAADQGAFCDSLLRGFGLLSIAIAAVFILSQKDFKRMLAYSSVEHMGILALGVGMGGAATFGAMLHTVNHSLVKAMLFLLAGNILDFYRTKKIPDVTGMLRTQPATGALWVAGLFAISGFPPFGTFLSEFVVLKGAFEGGFILEGVALLAFLCLIFIGMASAFLPMSQGNKIVQEEGQHSHWKPSFWSIAPPLVLCGLALLIGCFLPPALHELLQAAARSLGGS